MNTLAIKSLIQSRGLPSFSCYSPRSPRSAISSPENSHLLDAFLKQSCRQSALESVCEIARYTIPQRRISRPLISARIPLPSKTNFACRRLPDRPVMSPHSGNNPSQTCAALIMFPIRQACLFAKCVREMDDLDVDSVCFVLFFRPELIKDQCAGMFLQQILVSPHGLHQLSMFFILKVLSSHPASRSEINSSAYSCDRGGEALHPRLNGLHSHRKCAERESDSTRFLKKWENWGEHGGQRAL